MITQKNILVHEGVGQLLIDELGQRVELDYNHKALEEKGDVEEYIAIPAISKEKIAAEILIVKYLTYEVITNCSEVQKYFQE